MTMLRTKVEQLTQAALKKTKGGTYGLGPLFGEVKLSQAVPIVERFFVELLERLSAGETIRIPGFGTFTRRVRASRKIRPYAKGEFGKLAAELVELPARAVITFKPARVKR